MWREKSTIRGMSEWRSKRDLQKKKKAEREPGFGISSE